MKIFNSKYHIVMVFTLLAFIFSSTSLSAQIAIRGKVTEGGTGLPLPFLNVVVKGTMIGTMTAEDGTYSINAAPNAVLEFKGIGYKTLEANVSNRSVIDVVVETDNLLLDEVVLVGFGTQRRANLTGAVETVDTKALESRPVANLSAGLQGLSPGLSLYWTSGQLNAEPTIRLRGSGTIQRGTNNYEAGGGPLILIDGVPGELSTINPDDVENISILKDAASASIYGARAAFGAVLITTKSGQNNERLRYTYNVSMGWSNPTEMLEHMDPVKELRYIIDQAAHNGDNRTESWGAYHDITLPGIEKWNAQYKNKRDPLDMNMVLGEDFEFIGRTAYFYRVWEANKVMFGNNVPTMNHSFNMSGKIGQNSTLMASIGFNDRKGVLRMNPDHMKRYNITMNVSTQLAKWLTADVRVMMSRSDYSQPYNYQSSSTNYGSINSDAYVGEMYRYGAYAPYGTYDGTGWGWGPGQLRAASYNNSISDNVRLQGVLRATITPELMVQAEYSIAQRYSNAKFNGGNIALWKHQSGANAVDGKPDLLYAADAVQTAVSETRNSSQTEVFNLYAVYDKQFGNGHNFSARVGLNSEWRDNSSATSSKRGILDNSKPEIDLAVGTQTVYGSHNWSSMSGMFARVNYDYLGKYLIEGNIRYDGSSRFPAGSKWGAFPSGSIGWRLSEEPFMKNIRAINNLKLRVSAGMIGNEDVTTSLYEPTMNSSYANWLANGISSQGPTTFANPRSVAEVLSWEKVTTYNFGLDLGLWNMLSITGEIFQRNTYGVLTQGKALPMSFGTDAAYINAGNIRGRGWELSVTFNKMVNKDFSIYAAATVSDAIQKVTSWESEGALRTSGGDPGFYEGMILGEIWGLTTDRLLQESDFSNGVINSALPDQSALIKSTFKLEPGDVLYKDLDGDNKIDTGEGTIKNHGDLSVIGYNTPRYEYSFRFGGNYKGFDLNVFFQGVGKREIAAGNSDVILPMQRGYPDLLYAHQEDHWRPDNTDGFYPRLWRYRGGTIPGVYGSNNSITQTRYLLNLAYLRLKNVTVGYTIPSNFTQKFNVDRLYVYFSAENLITWKDTNLPMDPEVTRSSSMLGRGFPMQRTLSVGARVNF